MPILFRVCWVRQTPKSPTARKFPPPSIWPYIKSITVHDILCPDSNRYTPVPGESLIPRCGIVNGAIAESFRGMPQLHTIHLIHGHHGIPWLVLQAILSLPQLREFSCTPQISYTPEGSARLQELVLDSLASLTSFRYTRDIHAISHLFDTLQNQAEEHLLNLVLRSVHMSLIALALPIESAPLRAMTSLDFPQLQELRIKGFLESAQELQCNLISALHRMPELRILELDIALSPHHAPRPLWPPGLATTYSWPHLQQLCVSFPRVQDQVYSHVPRNLTHLALRYSPHYIIHRWEVPWNEAAFAFPSSSADDILRILQQCKTQDLVELEVEYHQSEDDDMLLRHIAVAYPKLETLRLFRYCREGTREINVETVGQLLHPLKRLRTLWLHMDLSWQDNTQFRRNDRASLDRFQQAADALARTLGPSVAVIKMLRPQRYFEREYEWGVYQVVRDDPERAAPYTRYSYFLTHGEEEPEDEDHASD
ncbi:hypothetical protein C8Q73DRAFT_305451 [Cubamyces lactineus]|nr:hypothetical protein C8Q73DRAFT_305451 [Cubamyces lactineus]